MKSKLPTNKFGFPLFGRLLGAFVLGVIGFIFGTLLDGMSVFPGLAWDNIFLFLGVIVGLFKEELTEYFGS